MGNEFSEKLALGNKFERLWAKKLVALYGGCVFPLWESDDGPPRLVTADFDPVLPDMLHVPLSGIARLWEVKWRAESTWHRNSSTAELGIDYSLYQQYRQVERETGMLVSVAVYVDRIHDDSGELGDCKKWLIINLGLLGRYGRLAPTWPGGTFGNHGRDDAGGILWPVKKMKKIC